MKKAIWVVGGFAGVTVVSMAVFNYFEGLAFAKWFFGPLIFGPLILGSIGALLICSVGLVVSAIRRKIGVLDLHPILVIPAVLYLLILLPLPGFIDGLHEAVKKNIDRDRALQFEHAVRELSVSRFDVRDQSTEIENLRNAFVQELNLAGVEANVSVTAQGVKVYYGNALMNHWGFAIVKEDQCPLSHIPEHMCRKVYDNVWVYEDIY